MHKWRISKHKMKRYKRISLFCIVVLILHCGISLQIVGNFRLQPNPPKGPDRLSKPWTDRSLVFCIASCMTRYPTKCKSIIYEPVTQLCTPGGWLNQSEASPTVAEGRLYITTEPQPTTSTSTTTTTTSTTQSTTTKEISCTSYQGFMLKTYNSATACIAFVQVDKTQHEASADCQRRGGHLYTMRNPDKLKILQQLSLTKETWIGINDKAREGTYVWDDNGEVIDQATIIALFNPGEPNNFLEQENCAIVEPGTFKLNDNICDLLWHYICEEDI